MKKRVIFLIKLALLAAVLGFVGRQVFLAWRGLGEKHLLVDWRFAPAALLGFAGVMITSGGVWRWLAWRMGDSAGGKGRTLPLLGAYTFSQMGKYIPGKVMLLVMRIERAGRFGMKAGVCTLSTLLENALYMVSGGLVGMLAIVKVASQLDSQKQALVWPVTVAAVAGLALACHPAIFYRLVNGLLLKMKKSAVPAEQRLGMGTLALGVLGFVPCWICGGIALWGSACCVQPVPLVGCVWFAGAFALSVIIGMASLLPGGLGVREAVLGAAAMLAFSGQMEHDKAVLLGAAVAILQRFFQVMVEVGLGLLGMAVTARKAVLSPDT